MGDSDFESPHPLVPSASNGLHNEELAGKRYLDKAIVNVDLKRKVNTFCRLYDAINLVRSKLLPYQVELFRKTVFGKFLDAKEMLCSGLLLHFLRGNLLDVEVGNNQCPRDFVFEIEGRRVVFSISHLAEFFGFNVVDNIPQVDNEVTDRGRIWEKYFPSCSKSVKRNAIKQVLQSIKRGSVSDNDIVKLSLLHVLSQSFLAAEGQVTVKGKYLNLVDNLENFNKYPWGRVVWDDMDTYFRASVASMKSNPEHYNIYGCVLALQIWAFECFPILTDIELAQCVDPTARPLCLKWTSTTKTTADVLKNTIFCKKHFAFVPMQIQNAVLGECSRATKKSKKCALSTPTATISSSSPRHAPNPSTTLHNRTPSLSSRTQPTKLIPQPLFVAPISTSPMCTRSKTNVSKQNQIITIQSPNAHPGSSSCADVTSHDELRERVHTLEKQLITVNKDILLYHKKFDLQEAAIAKLRAVVEKLESTTTFTNNTVQPTVHSNPSPPQQTDSHETRVPVPSDAPSFQISLTPTVPWEPCAGNDELGWTQAIDIAYDMLEGNVNGCLPQPDRSTPSTVKMTTTPSVSKHDKFQTGSADRGCSYGATEISFNNMEVESVSLHNSVSMNVLSQVNNRPKRKVVEPSRFTPGSQAIRKTKQSTAPSTANPLAGSPFTLITNSTKRQEFHKYMMKGIIRGQRSANNAHHYTPDVDKDFLLELDPGLTIESCQLHFFLPTYERQVTRMA
ncbi:unnamed protein product [Cuscuta europaea]|uniref:DUF1985 domain-containing protein n=1 Tax=Cuscuta europaea TaxID=41803 RepID=A0A9P1E888_CUSEU|nr:unnamed protein product [Cuscuta europaea]